MAPIVNADTKRGLCHVSNIAKRVTRPVCKQANKTQELLEPNSSNFVRRRKIISGVNARIHVVILSYVVEASANRIKTFLPKLVLPIRLL